MQAAQFQPSTTQSTRKTAKARPSPRRCSINVFELRHAWGWPLAAAAPTLPTRLEMRTLSYKRLSDNKGSEERSKGREGPSTISNG